MARPVRILIPDGWYHVFGRGWERRPIFRDDRDRARFLELLDELHEVYRFVIHAYALMDNHHHLIVQTPDANLSQGMQWFDGTYAGWFNTRHGRAGALWQGRYRDVVVEDDGWAFELSLYVHLNPLRIAGLGLDKRGRVLEAQGFREPTKEEVSERLRRLRAYRWSSYRAYAGYCAAPSWLTTEVLLGQCGGGAAQQRASYRAETKQRLTYGVPESRAERLRDGVAIGSEAFARRIREALGEDLDGLQQKRELRRRISVEEVRSAVEQLRGQRWKEFAGRRGDWGRDLFLWGVRKRCGLTLQEAGRASGGMTLGAVAVALSRLDERACDEKEIRTAQRELLRLLDSEAKR